MRVLYGEEGSLSVKRETRWLTHTSYAKEGSLASTREISWLMRVLYCEEGSVTVTRENSWLMRVPQAHFLTSLKYSKLHTRIKHDVWVTMRQYTFMYVTMCVCIYI
jgi:hypothetical protein